MSPGECACNGNTLDRLLRPVVMAILARAPEGQHGYVIAQDLRSLAVFEDNPPDTAGLYRVLKSMEEEGHLKSDWLIEGSGPAKRVYRLTDDGWGCLRSWLCTLDSYVQSVQETADFVRASLAAQPQRRNAK
jgi:DNA-binding PadR family transcriptional regulator